jgi:hypothetical protein
LPETCEEMAAKITSNRQLHGFVWRYIGYPWLCWWIITSVFYKVAICTLVYRILGHTRADFCALCKLMAKWLQARHVNGLPRQETNK